MDGEAPQRRPRVTLSWVGSPEAGCGKVSCGCFRKPSQIKPLGKCGQETRKRSKGSHNRAESHRGNFVLVLQGLLGTHSSHSGLVVSGRRAGVFIFPNFPSSVRAAQGHVNSQALQRSGLRAVSRRAGQGQWMHPGAPCLKIPKGREGLERLEGGGGIRAQSRDLLAAEPKPERGSERRWAGWPLPPALPAPPVSELDPATSDIW